MPGLARSIRRSRRISSIGKWALGPFFVCLCGSAGAEDLLQVYRDAQGYDAVYNAARYALDAGRERIPQARALLLPTLNATGNVSRQSNDVNSSNPALTPSFNRSVSSSGYTLTVTQPIFRPQNFVAREQAEFQVRQAEATFGQAAQDLALRVVQAYFDVLSAQDTLALVGAQKAAISEQLAQAKRNFEVGTATITDTHEAQARYDLSVAQEIVAQNDLDSKRRALQLITGKEYAHLAALRTDVKAEPPQPADMQSWVNLAEQHAYPVLAQEAAAQVAKLEAKRQNAGHYPTLDLVGAYNETKDNGSVISPIGRTVDTGQIGVQIAFPLYQGGAISSREREAAANALRSREDLLNARRSAALTTRQTYLAVVNGIAQVNALEQALVSSQSALESNRLGYEVGVRINIDVLNAQQQLFSTRRDLALARYNLLVNQLRLRAAVGGLTQENLERVNAALVP